MSQPPGPPDSIDASDPADSEDRRGFSLHVLAVTATWTISLVAYYAQGQLLGSIMSEFGRGEEAVGWLFSLENTVLALTALAVAGPLARWSRVRSALGAGVLVIAGGLAAAFAPSFEVLIASRVVAGAGEGVIGACGMASAASSRQPDRIFAIVTFTWGVLASLPPTVVPYATGPYGSTGGFLLLTGIVTALLPLCVRLVPPTRAPETKPSLFTAPNRAIAVVVMASLLVFEVGQGGVYTFIEQIGLRSDLDTRQIGLALTGTGLAGLVGALLAAWLGTRFGRKWPIGIGIALNVVAALWLTLGHDPASFVAMNLLWNAAYYFVIPYTMGAMAGLDHLGRWVVASDAVWTLGDGIGPGVAGTLVERAGYDGLASLATFTGVQCVVILVLVMRYIESRDDLA